MMYNRNNFIGLSGFIWWVGEITNMIDPLGFHRCQVRIFGWHTDDTSALPTEDLPWAYALLPINNSQSVELPSVGDWVVGFFMDGESGQMPVMLGVMPGIKTTETAVDTNTYSNTGTLEQQNAAQSGIDTTSSTTPLSGKLVNGQPSGPIIYNGQTVNPGDAGYAAASAALIAELNPGATTTVVPSGTLNFNGF